MDQPSRVFITGAAGFIGGALGDRYRSMGAEIAGVDQRDDPERGIVAGDVAEAGDWQRHARGADLLIHTAAVVSNAVDADTTWRINVLGTRRAVEAARDAGAARMVHFSSVRAFSDRHYPDGADESWPIRADGNAYVDTKVASEQVVLQAHAAGEVSATIVRPGDVYGPGSRPWTILVLEAIKAGTVALPAMGKGIFTPVYVETLVDGVVLAAASPDAAGQVFTLTDGVNVTTREFFGHYYRMLGRDGPKVVPTAVALTATAAMSAVARARRRPTEINPTAVRYLARTGGYSIAKARDLLGYNPQIDLAEGMRRTETWLREEGLI
jgi:nucleoside-diphosphate-sugar epimerase